MNTHIPNFNGFPTDNSSSTNFKYDLIASKMMTRIQNRQRRLVPAPSVGIVFSISGDSWT
ncbi:hypothetical protein ACFPVY_03095 [Flavobacterium qiangtangense]|uniref:Uncharacterized protein n=1 Tax=Flavobacterium qiangtangense TaxID=1442595 RepID=A0ABW1PKZ5_9FLAO